MSLTKITVKISKGTLVIRYPCEAAPKCRIIIHNISYDTILYDIEEKEN